MTKKPSKPARLIRFVGEGVLPLNVAAQYDAANNLVRVDKSMYDKLNTFEQSELMFATEDIKIFGV